VDAGALFEELADAWEAARPVTVAAIHGGVYGGATDLALACDFRLGVPSCLGSALRRYRQTLMGIS
jgi:enoyl-CoA hydratase/carnithine racemase